MTGLYTDYCNWWARAGLHLIAGCVGSSDRLGKLVCPLPTNRGERNALLIWYCPPTDYLPTCKRAWVFRMFL